MKAKLQEIVDRKLTLDFSWFQKKEVQDSGRTIAQEYLFSLGILEWGANLVYDEDKYERIINPLEKLNGYAGSLRSWRGKCPRIKSEPFLLVPVELALRILVLGELP